MEEEGLAFGPEFIRVVGPCSDATPAQVSTAAQIISDCAGKIIWDGDKINAGSYSAALAPFLEKWVSVHSPSDVVHNSCVPGNDGTWSTQGDMCVGQVPAAVALTAEDFDAAKEKMEKHIGWDLLNSDEAFGKSAQYLFLAIGSRLKYPNITRTLWLLQENRAIENYSSWVCLAEFKACKLIDAGTPFTVIAADGSIVAEDALETLPWFSMTPAALSWTSQAIVSKIQPDSKESE